LGRANRAKKKSERGGHAVSPKQFRYLTRIIKSSERHPIVRHIANTRSRDFATIVTKERVGMCKTIQERILRFPLARA
jgi:hypothetical protein